MNRSIMTARAMRADSGVHPGECPSVDALCDKTVDLVNVDAETRSRPIVPDHAYQVVQKFPPESLSCGC